MPELPEVETIASGLNRRIAREGIDSVWIGNKSNLLKSPAVEIERTLTGSRIAAVRRIGKHIVVDLELMNEFAQTAEGKQSDKRAGKLAGKQVDKQIGKTTAQWIVHLGMTGRLLICDAAAELAPHTHFIAKLSSGRELRFVDPRRFGKLAVRSGSDFAGPGAEPLAISAADFAALFRGRKTPIKAALLNQKLLHGVGNIYADESLFRAGVRPRRRAASLTRAELEKLRKGLQAVLKQAIRAGGSSVSDYVDEMGEEGLFQLKHNVYLRTGKPCGRCGTPIKRITLAGRGTHFCPSCQK